MDRLWGITHTATNALYNKWYCQTYLLGSLWAQTVKTKRGPQNTTSRDANERNQATLVLLRYTSLLKLSFSGLVGPRHQEASRRTSALQNDRNSHGANTSSYHARTSPTLPPTHAFTSRFPNLRTANIFENSSTPTETGNGNMYEADEYLMMAAASS